jgi:hypothetical protein
MSVEPTVANQFRAEALELRQQQLSATTTDHRHEYARRASFLEAAAKMLDLAMVEAGLA